MNKDFEEKIEDAEWKGKPTSNMLLYISRILIIILLALWLGILIGSSFIIPQGKNILKGAIVVFLILSLPVWMYFVVARLNIIMSFANKSVEFAVNENELFAINHKYQEGKLKGLLFFTFLWNIESFYKKNDKTLIILLKENEEIHLGKQSVKTKKVILYKIENLYQIENILSKLIISS